MMLLCTCLCTGGAVVHLSVYEGREREKERERERERERESVTCLSGQGVVFYTILRVCKVILYTRLYR